MAHDGPRRDFARLWAALTVSLMGTEITALALPLFAAVTLRASPVEMGILAAAGQLPFLLFSLPAGAWVDRMRRRPVLIAADVVSALLLLSLPLAVPLGGPGFVQLCVVAFGIGTLATVSEVAHYAYVPALVGREHVTRANSNLQVSHSATAALGPGVAGLLVQLFTVPFAVLVDAASFLVSAALLRSIRQPEPSVARPADGSPSVLRSIADGLHVLLGQPVLRAIIVASVPISFFANAFMAIYVVFATREVGLDALAIGLIFAAGGAGAVGGAVVSRRAAERFGVGPATVAGWVLSGVATLLVPLASGPAAVLIAILALSKAFEGLTGTVANIHQWSLRQMLSPDHLAGRVTAGHRFTVYGAAAAGAFVGGVVAEAIGLRSALLLFAAGATLSPLTALRSPLSRLREDPSSDAG